MKIAFNGEKLIKISLVLVALCSSYFIIDFTLENRFFLNNKNQKKRLDYLLVKKRNPIKSSIRGESISFLLGKEYDEIGQNELSLRHYKEAYQDNPYDLRIILQLLSKLDRTEIYDLDVAMVIESGTRITECNPKLNYLASSILQKAGFYSLSREHLYKIPFLFGHNVKCDLLVLENLLLSILNNCWSYSVNNDSIKKINTYLEKNRRLLSDFSSAKIGSEHYHQSIKNINNYRLTFIRFIIDNFLDSEQKQILSVISHRKIKHEFDTNRSMVDFNKHLEISVERIQQFYLQLF